MAAPGKDPGIPEDLKVQCDAPPEPQIPTTHDQENQMNLEINAETNVGQAEEKTKDDLEGLEKTTTIDRDPGEATGDGVNLTTMPPSHESKQLPGKEKEPRNDGSEESLAASEEKIEAGKPSSRLVAEDMGIEVAAARSTVAHDCNVIGEKNVSKEVELPAASNVSTPLEDAPQPDNSVVLEISSESEIGPAPETALAPEFPPDLKSSLIAMPYEEVEKLWEDAIGSQNVGKLLEIVRERLSDVLMLEKEGERRGRTALHIAAKSDDVKGFELAEAILDQLFKFQQVSFTIRIFSSWKMKGSFYTIGDYIRAVEKASKKRAMELAKESCNQSIAEYIEDIQKRSAAHAKIDRDIAIVVDSVKDYDEDFFKCTDSEKRGKAMTWLRKVIAARYCMLLMKVVEELPSQPTEALWEDEYWKCEDKSRTMLHVAAMQGCFPLAKRLLDRARVMEDCKYVQAEDGLSGLTAFQMANDIIGNRSIAEYITNTLELMKNKDYVHACFREVYTRTTWWIMLASGDEEMISFVLSKNYCLLLERYEGCTILHVAILAQSLELVKHVVQAFGQGKKISFGDSYFPSELTWQQMRDEEVEIDKSLFDVTRSHVFLSSLSMEARPSFSSSFRGSAMQLIEHMIELKGTIDDADDGFFTNVASMLEEYDKAIVVTLSEESTILSITHSTLKNQIEENWNMEWDKAYSLDVDFNFEVEPRLTLLKLHYACKHFLIYEAFLKSLFNLDGEILEESCHVQDGQGRTILHILLDYSDNVNPCPGKWILNEIFINGYNFQILFRDARGRSLNDILLVKNYLQQNILLENIKEFRYESNFTKSLVEIDDVDIEDKFFNTMIDCNPMNNIYYYACFMSYHVATIWKQTNVAQNIWTNILEKNPKQLMELCKREEVPYIAASTGNQVMLRFLMENLIDLTITDARKRNLLHHAANPTLLGFDVLLKCPMIGQCFSTVKDLCEAKKKWNFERKQTSMIFPSLELDKDFDMGKHVTCVNMERKACILLLLQEGVDLSQEDEDKKVPNIGPTDDSTYQSWWYDMVVKDSIDKKNSFNQAAGALSVVGTLVAATSYIGPLQPPMNFTDDGFLRNYVLIKVFMMSNTFAFYLAMTSVIFAVVPSLPMPQESARMELKRAKHVVSISLHILLMSIISIIVSFGVASMVVMQDQDLFPGSDLLFLPSIIGCLFCLIAIVSFLNRVMRLTFHSSPTIRRLYKFSFTKSCKDAFQFIKSYRDASCKQGLIGGLVTKLGVQNPIMETSS